MSINLGFASFQLPSGRLAGVIDVPGHERFLKNMLAGAGGIDLVVLTANPWPAYRTAVEIVRPNGRVAIVSLLGRGEEPLDFNPLSMQYFYIKGISLIAVCGPAGYLYPNESPYATLMEDRYAADRNAAHIISLMAAPEGHPRLEPKRLITHRFHPEDAAAAYDLLTRDRSTAMGVVFEW